MSRIKIRRCQWVALINLASRNTLKSGPGYFVHVTQTTWSNTLADLIHSRCTCTKGGCMHYHHLPPSGPNSQHIQIRLSIRLTCPILVLPSGSSMVILGEGLFCPKQCLWGWITHMNECGGPKVSHRDTALGVGSKSGIPTVYAPVLALSCTVAQRKCV